MLEAPIVANILMPDRHANIKKDILTPVIIYNPGKHFTSISVKRVGFH